MSRMLAVCFDAPFVLTGQVVSEKVIGHRFTVPTLNSSPNRTSSCPGRLHHADSSSRRTRESPLRHQYRSAPHFNGTSLTVETHLLDAPKEFETKRIEIRFWKRLREEKNSASRGVTRRRSLRYRARPPVLFAPAPFPHRTQAAALAASLLGVSSPLPLSAAERLLLAGICFAFFSSLATVFCAMLCSWRTHAAPLSAYDSSPKQAPPRKAGGSFGRSSNFLHFRCRRVLRRRQEVCWRKCAADRQ